MSRQYELRNYAEDCLCTELRHSYDLQLTRKDGLCQGFDQCPVVRREVSDEIDCYDRTNCLTISAINATFSINGPNASGDVPDCKSSVPKDKKAIYGTSA